MTFIVSVFERHTAHCLAASKVHDETLFFTNLAILCQPVIGSMYIAFPVIVIVHREDVGCWELTTPSAVTFFRSPGASIAGAADYLLRATVMMAIMSEVTWMTMKWMNIGEYTPPTAIQSWQQMKFSKNIRPYWPAEAP